MEYKAQMGDIFLVDSDKTGAKITKFFMQAPTIYQWLWRKIRGTQEVVNYYHAGMILGNDQLIEQEAKVEYGDLQKRLTQRIVIYRNKNLNLDQMILLRFRAISQLGQGYGIEDIIAHTLTWLTGIRLFVILIGSLTRNTDICVNRVARWYNHIDNFGINWYEVTTKTMDEYCSKSSDWERVYING